MQPTTQPTEPLLSSKTLRITLYSGIALIVISMLFLGQGQSSFLLQAAIAFSVPALFYGVGLLVYRYLNAPLAAPGIVATGAWLTAVELIHLWNQRHLLPDFIQPYYWLGASLLAAGIITITGHKAKIWLLLPLVPLAQVNAMWAVMGATGLSVAWWPALSFLLVLAWWELPFQAKEWSRVYRVSAVLLEVFLLIFSSWLPANTEYSMVTAWGACALLVAILGLRHGWVNLGPLSIVLLTGAVAWGLPVMWWSPIWTLIGVGTVIFIEQLARHNPEKNNLAIELSATLAILLCGFAALLTVAAPFIGLESNIFLTITTLLASGLLLTWIGWRGPMVVAEHAGLWLVAAGWAKIYTAWMAGSVEHEAFGLWLSLLAVAALSLQQLLLRGHGKKRKIQSSVREAVVSWPLADVIIGLSLIILIWTMTTIPTLTTGMDAFIMTLTLAITIGVWLVAGLIYRLPVLLHVALWLAPLPYALLLILIFPSYITLPLLGLSWQLLGISYLAIGHSLPRLRPVILAPFFITGYALLGIGLTFTMGTGTILLISLALVIGVCFFSSLAIVFNFHPAWDAMAARLNPPEKRPYAHAHIHQLSIFLTAWLLPIWLQLALDHTSLTFSRQGIVLVLLSSLWVVIGRLMPRFTGLIGWPVYAAGWFMWLIGLLMIFFAPTEAIIAAIFGLALSSEAVYRTRAIAWMPIFILQILFSALQISVMLNLPGYSLLLGVTSAIALTGLTLEHNGHWAGKITFQTSGLLSLCLWVLYLNPYSTAIMAALALAALGLQRKWWWLAATYTFVVIFASLIGVTNDWHFTLIAGGCQLVIGAILSLIRPRRFMTLTRYLFDNPDWATPFLWFGMFSLAVGYYQLWDSAAGYDFIAAVFVCSGLIFSLLTITLHIRHLPFLPIACFITAGVCGLIDVAHLPMAEIGNPMAVYGVGVAFAAIFCVIIVQLAVRQLRPFINYRWLVWWIRPLQHSGIFFAAFSIPVFILARGLYDANIAWATLHMTLLSLYFFIAAYRVVKQERHLHEGLVGLGVSFFFAALAWAFLLAAFNLHGAQWYTLPGAIVLLAAARFAGIHATGLENLAFGVILYGGLFDTFHAGLPSWAAIILIFQIIGLVLYGYVAGRRGPFFSGLSVMIGGVFVGIFYINAWLMALVIGIILLGGALLMEVRREQVERWLWGWKQRVEQWS